MSARASQEKRKGTPSPPPPNATNLAHAAAVLDENFRLIAWIAASLGWESDEEPRGSEQFAAVTRVPADVVLRRTHAERARAAGASEEQLAAHTSDLQPRRPFRDFRYSLRGPDGAMRQVKVGGQPRRGPDGRLQAIAASAPT
jgi:hypothetical protein